MSSVAIRPTFVDAEIESIVVHASLPESTERLLRSTPKLAERLDADRDGLHMARSTLARATNLGRRRESAKVEAGPAYQARREEIIAAAGHVFLEKGYPATSFKDIAEAIGMDRASLYYYFESKQDLFRVATGKAVARNVKDAERIARSDGKPAAKIAEIIAKLLESLTEADYPYMFIFLQEDVNQITAKPDDPWAREFTALTRRYERAITSIIQEGVSRGDFAIAGPPHVLTKTMIGMANWTVRWYRPEGKLTGAELARIFAHTFLHGVVTKGGGSLPQRMR